MVKLTPKQQRSVEEYLVDLNATQAEIRAGYSTKTANNEEIDCYCSHMYRSGSGRIFKESWKRLG